jgi:hypothetical protein
MRIVWFMSLVLALSGPNGAPAVDEQLADDEKLLREAGVGLDGPALLELFRKRSLTESDLKRLEEVVRQLGSSSFQEREQATEELKSRGSAELPLLRKALTDVDAEIVRRARGCIEEIENGPAVTLPLAAARLVARRKPAGAVAQLLNYLPYAEEVCVVEEVLETLLVVAGVPGEAKALIEAARSPQAIHREAAGFVLGRSMVAAERDLARGLLADKEPGVRLRAVQGLLAARDKAAVPVLIELLGEPLGDLAWQVEDTLERLAGEQAPPLQTGDKAPSRGERRAAWARWWQEHSASVDLARLQEQPRLLGRTLIPEMHANKVWECGKDQKPLWTIANLQCPIDAEVLPGGRILIAELNGNRVSERDLAGNIRWEVPVQTPIACQRLPGGLTFISTNHRVCVLTREKKEVMVYEPEKEFFIHSVQRLRNGHTVMVSIEGTVREIDSAGKVLRTVTLPIKGGWSGIEGLAGNRYLVVNHSQGKVLEVSVDGKTLWEHTVPGACYASRLPGGNTLVISNNTGLVEIDRDRKVVWECKITTSLWRGHRR